MAGLLQKNTHPVLKLQRTIQSIVHERTLSFPFSPALVLLEPVAAPAVLEVRAQTTMVNPRAREARCCYGL